MKHPARTLALGLLVGLTSSPFTLFAAEKAVLQGHVFETRPVSFEVYIPIQHREQLEKDLDAMHDPASPAYRRWLTPAEFQTRYGATPKQIEDMRQELESKGLSATVMAGNRIHVTGQAGAIERAFGTHLESGVYKNGKMMVAATRTINMPDSLKRVGAVVVGLANTMPMKTHSHLTPAPANRYSNVGPYWFTDLKQAYSYPSFEALTGRGVTIATLVDGGLGREDMALYFGHEKLTTPRFSEEDVDGGSPFNSSPYSGSFETNLDLQQAGGMAPGASFIHYNLPDLFDISIIDGLYQILNDNVADIVSMSFGGSELFYTPEYNGGMDYTYILRIEDDLFAQGNAQGITFVASSGDEGALTVPPLICFTGIPDCGKELPSVEFPASSPHVTGVGGTNLVTTYNGGATKNSAYVLEEAFADPLSGDRYGTSSTGNYWGSGGGDSIVFLKPTPQRLIDTGNDTYRTVPDIALHMGGCPYGVVGPCNPDDSADLEYLGGLLYGAIGTSAAAPDFAGLVALGEERDSNQRIGNVNYALYKIGSAQAAGGSPKAFHTAIPSFNGLYGNTSKFYNRVTGLGTPIGVDILFMPASLKAGVPQTPSNP